MVANICPMKPSGVQCSSPTVPPGLQTRTMEFSQSSLYRSQATALTDDVLDRMRADYANAVNGLWDTATTDASCVPSGFSVHLIRSLVFGSVGS